MRAHSLYHTDTHTPREWYQDRERGWDRGRETHWAIQLMRIKRRKSRGIGQRGKGVGWKEQNVVVTTYNARPITVRALDDSGYEYAQLDNSKRSDYRSQHTLQKHRPPKKRVAKRFGVRNWDLRTGNIKCRIFVRKLVDDSCCCCRSRWSFRQLICSGTET